MVIDCSHHGTIGGTKEIPRAEDAFTSADVRTTFYRIPAYNYFDLALSFRIAKQVGFRITANNLLDKDPPIIPNSYSVSLSRNNTIPQRYDSLGRNIAIGTTIKF